jgi:signal transduction histidine kinase
MSKKSIKDSKERGILVETSMLYNISELAQSVAYDINNPLMIIDGFAKKIKKDHRQEEYDDLSKDLEAIKKASERINNIVTNLITYSRENLKLPIEKISFSELAVEAIKRALEDNPSFKGEISIDSSGSEDVEVNFSLFSQAIVNVLTKALTQSVKTEQLQIKLSFRKVRDCIELVIKDNGEKITEEMQSSMFYQTFTTDRDGQTLGLGMNSSFNIAKKFNGQLYFDNSYAENAFIFSFNSSH